MERHPQHDAEELHAGLHHDNGLHAAAYAGARQATGVGVTRPIGFVDPDGLLDRFEFGPLIEHEVRGDESVAAHRRHFEDLRGREALRPAPDAEGAGCRVRLESGALRGLFDAKSGRYSKWQRRTAIAASGPLDGIPRHVGSRGYAYADIYSTNQINAGGQNLYWSFYVYKDWINYGIPPSLYSLPLYVTECNGLYYWKGGGPPGDLNSFDILPLRSRDRVSGLLGLGSLRENAFGDELRETLRIFAHEAAIVLDNSLLYRQLGRAYREPWRL